MIDTEDLAADRLAFDGDLAADCRAGTDTPEKGRERFADRPRRKRRPQVSRAGQNDLHR